MQMVKQSEVAEQVQPITTLADALGKALVGIDRRDVPRTPITVGAWEFIFESVLRNGERIASIMAMYQGHDVLWHWREGIKIRTGTPKRTPPSYDEQEAIAALREAVAQLGRAA